MVCRSENGSECQSVPCYINLEFIHCAKRSLIPLNHAGVEREGCGWKRECGRSKRGIFQGHVKKKVLLKKFSHLAQNKKTLQDVSSSDNVSFPSNSILTSSLADSWATCTGLSGFRRRHPLAGCYFTPDKVDWEVLLVPFTYLWSKPGRKIPLFFSFLRFIFFITANY